MRVLAASDTHLLSGAMLFSIGVLTSRAAVRDFVTGLTCTLSWWSRGDNTRMCWRFWKRSCSQLVTSMLSPSVWLWAANCSLQRLEYSTMEMQQRPLASTPAPEDWC